MTKGPEMPKVAVLHTSFVFATVVREQGISARSEERMVLLARAAEAAGADVIFSACSSLGPTLDAASRAVGVPVVKIDEAMAVDAARFGRIGVLATVPTTLGPTSELIAGKAARAGQSSQIVRRLCPGAFDVLMAGDCERHDEMVAAQASILAAEVDVIVLAQGVHAATGPAARGRDRCSRAVQPTHRCGAPRARRSRGDDVILGP